VPQCRSLDRCRSYSPKSTLPEPPSPRACTINPPIHRRDLAERLISLGSRFKFLGALRSLGTRRPNWRAFVDWQTYYRPYLGADSGPALIKHTVPWVGDQARHTELIDALAAGRRAAVVWAPPGCGKSRFALELARRLEAGGDRWQPLFVNHDATTVREELPELSQMERVVLIVDDAQNCPELVEILAQAPATQSSLHIVCIARTSGRIEVTRALTKPGAIHELNLGRPAQKLVRSLIDQLLSKISPMHRDTIDRFVRQSFFGAVFLGTLVSREKKLPQSFQRQYLRDHFCRQPFIEPTREVCPIEPALRALAAHAALAPCAKEDASIREAAAQLSGLTVEKVELLLNRVIAAGLFQEDSHGRVRPAPDVLGDLILEEVCLDIQGKPTPYSSQLLGRVFEIDANAAMTNCGEIGQLFAASNDVDLLSKIILDRARTVSRDNVAAVLQLLQLCQPLAISRAATVVEVAGILESRGILRRDTPTDSVELNVLALLLSAAQSETTAVPTALALGRDLYINSLPDENARRQLRELLESASGFAVGRSVEYCRSVAQGLQAWIADANVQVAATAASLSGQFLRVEQLQPSPEVSAVRDIAVDTLVRGIAHANTGIQCAAVAALEHYAHHPGESDQALRDGWQPQIAREVTKLSEAMIKLVKASSSLPVLACVELQGWLWWARDLEDLHNAGTTALQAVPDSDAYRFWKSLYAQRLPLRIDLPAESSDRAMHIRGFATTDEAQSLEQAKQLFNTLDPKHTEPGAWRKLWLSVLEQTPAGRMDSRADVVVAEFARRHQTEAWSFITEPDPKGVLFGVVPILLVELRKLDTAHASRVAQDVLPGSKLEGVWLQALWTVHDLNEGESTILARGLGSPDAATVYRTAGALLSATEIDRVGAFCRVFATVSRHPTDEELWALVIEHFVHWTEGLLDRSESKLTPTEPMSGVGDALIALFQSHGGQIRWGYQRHTRQLPAVFAILAIVQPNRLEQWMRMTFGTPGGSTGQWEDACPLSNRRLRESMSQLRGLPEATAAFELLQHWTTKPRS
jgi:hypothetical protein